MVIIDEFHSSREKLSERVPYRIPKMTHSLSLKLIGLIHLCFYIFLFRFPTIYWLPKNAKDSPVPYNGGREVKDFVKFIAEHSTDPLKGYTRDGKKSKSKKAEEL